MWLDAPRRYLTVLASNVARRSASVFDSTYLVRSLWFFRNPKFPIVAEVVKTFGHGGLQNFWPVPLRIGLQASCVVSGF